MWVTANSQNSHLYQYPIRRRLRLARGGQKRRRIIAQSLQPATNIAGVVLNMVGWQANVGTNEGAGEFVYKFFQSIVRQSYSHVPRHVQILKTQSDGLDLPRIAFYN